MIFFLIAFAKQFSEQSGFFLISHNEASLFWFFASDFFYIEIALKIYPPVTAVRKITATIAATSFF